MSKGTRPRPSVVSQQELAARHESIFGKKPPKNVMFRHHCHQNWQDPVRLNSSWVWHKTSTWKNINWQKTFKNH
jgi:hypothetical protein